MKSKISKVKNNKLILLFIFIALSGCSLFKEDTNRRFYLGNNAKVTNSNNSRTGFVDGIRACAKAHKELWGQSYASFQDYPTSVSERICGQGNKYYRDNPKYCFKVGNYFESRGHLRCSARWYHIGCSQRDNRSCASLNRVQRKIASDFQKHKINNNSELQYLNDSGHGAKDEN